MSAQGGGERIEDFDKLLSEEFQREQEQNSNRKAAQLVSNRISHRVNYHRKKTLSMSSENNDSAGSVGEHTTPSAKRPAMEHLADNWAQTVKKRRKEDDDNASVNASIVKGLLGSQELIHRNQEGLLKQQAMQEQLLQTRMEETRVTMRFMDIMQQGHAQAAPEPVASVYDTPMSKTSGDQE